MCTIAITLKYNDSEGDPKSIDIEKLKDKRAKKVFKKLIAQWKNKKVVMIPEHSVAIASDAILGILIVK